ncbi:hypothetical protein F5Y04DRAFT_223038 [Hypomontagnella monticulosa]|nr:hypothetical protein F5Y04DRAFT_223038 [Hypomontagnella monticulosa]
MIMSSSIPDPQTKYPLDNEEGIALSYLSSSTDNPDKKGAFGSSLSTVVDLDSDTISSDGRSNLRGLSPGPPLKPLVTHVDSGFRAWCRSTWRRNKAPLLVLIAQLFGASMNLMARLLEVGDEGMHPMQILFIRMVLTTLGSASYILWKKVPYGILGNKNIRWLLVLRGVCGFFGIYGMWYSVKYLPLAEATVITFLAPNIAGYMCHILIHDPFTWKEQVASFVALGGVVLITRPVSLFSGAFSSPTSSPTGRSIAMEIVAVANATTKAEPPYPGEEHVTTSAERLGAIGFALIGVLGAAGAFTTLRCIGKRAHPLISVNYFSTWCVIVTTTTLTLAPVLDYGQPDLHFELPHSARQWGLLLGVGVCGLLMQMLFTAGLAAERSNRATAMTYTHMLFAAAFDRFVFGHVMGWVSLSGCGLIVGSALWAALSKKEEAKTVDDAESEAERGVVAIAAMADSEAAPMLIEELDGDEGDGIMLRRL